MMALRLPGLDDWITRPDKALMSTFGKMNSEILLAIVRSISQILFPFLQEALTVLVGDQ